MSFTTSVFMAISAVFSTLWWKVRILLLRACGLLRNSHYSSSDRNCLVLDSVAVISRLVSPLLPPGVQVLHMEGGPHRAQPALHLAPSTDLILPPKSPPAVLQLHNTQTCIHTKHKHTLIDLHTESNMITTQPSGQGLNSLPCVDKKKMQGWLWLPEIIPFTKKNPPFPQAESKKLHFMINSTD